MSRGVSGVRDGNFTKPLGAIGSRKYQSAAAQGDHVGCATLGLDLTNAFASDTEPLADLVLGIGFSGSPMSLLGLAVTSDHAPVRELTQPFGASGSGSVCFD
jgi:hypothetical protein